MENKMFLVDQICAGMAILDYFDNAIIGYDMVTKRIVYDWKLMIDILMSEHELNEEEAEEYIDYNVLNLHLKNDDGENITPIIIGRFDYDDKL
jgi:hypothetical protein